MYKLYCPGDNKFVKERLHLNPSKPCWFVLIQAIVPGGSSERSVICERLSRTTVHRQMHGTSVFPILVSSIGTKHQAFRGLRKSYQQVFYFVLLSSCFNECWAWTCEYSVTPTVAAEEWYPAVNHVLNEVSNRCLLRCICRMRIRCTSDHNFILLLIYEMTNTVP